MGKSYDLCSKTDMKKFMKDLESQVKSSARTQALSGKYDVECPYCKNKVKLPVGKSLCPKCRQEVDLKLDINF